MASAIDQLKREAVQAHNAGGEWRAFWHRVGDRVRAVHPLNRSKLRRLCRDLRMIMLCGDGKAGSGDWWLDDAQNS